MFLEKAIYFKPTIQPQQVLNLLTLREPEWIDRTRTLLVRRGRDAIYLLLVYLASQGYKEVMLPSYLCDSVIAPFESLGMKYSFYAVGRDLSVNIEEMDSRLSRKQCPLFIIHYFGFPQNLDEITKICKDHQVPLIEDCAQSLLSRYKGKELGTIGEYGIMSYRKFLPVPDGGALVTKECITLSSFTSFCMGAVLSREIAILTMAQVVKSIHSKTGFRPMRLLLSIFGAAQDIDDHVGTPANMSELSLRLLAGIKPEEVFERTRENYCFLLDEIKHDFVHPLYPMLEDGVCPYGFPLLVEDRDPLREFLQRRGIETAIHWRLAARITKRFPGSKEVSDRILSLPIHYQLDSKQLTFIVDSVNSWRRHDRNVN